MTPTTCASSWPATRSGSGHWRSSRPTCRIRRRTPAFELSAGASVLAYTGDAGPDVALVDLARDADVLLAEASYVDDVPDDNRGTLSSARDAGRQAAAAGVNALVLTHLLPGTDRRRAREAARASFGGPIRVARGRADRRRRLAPAYATRVPVGRALQRMIRSRRSAAPCRGRVRDAGRDAARRTGETTASNGSNRGCARTAGTRVHPALGVAAAERQTV